MNYIRTFVSGNKKRYIDEKYNLDLSYITNRLIAMAYPASGLEKVYKNSINSVSKFLNDKHKGKYFIFNISGKKYDNSKFEGRVYEFDFQDHNIKSLFFICQGIHKFLNDNVAAIHCDAGKGRTVTVICCYLLYCGRFSSADQAFEYYNKKRLSTGDAVVQPSQKRYVYYFEQIMNERLYYPYLISIIDISLSKYPLRKADALRPFVEIWVDDKCAFSSKVGYTDQKKFYSKNNPPFLSINDSEFKFYCSGDITIKAYNNKMLTTKKLGMVTLNTAFFSDEQREIVFKLSEMDPDKLVKSKKIPKDLEMKLKFVRLCQCNNRIFPVETCEVCSKFISKHINYWQEIHRVLENHKPSEEEGRMFLFGDPTEDDIDIILKEGENGKFDLNKSILRKARKQKGRKT